MRRNQNKIKEKVEVELSKCLENGLSEQEAIAKVRQNLEHSYSVKLVRRYCYDEADKTKHSVRKKETPFFRKLKAAQIDGTPRVNGKVMK